MKIAVKQSHANNFDFLRFLGACFVFFSHAFALYGKHEPQMVSSASGFEEIYLGTFGVSIFFAISGFLITQSWLSTPKAQYFILKRVLRIYPAMVLHTLLVLFVIGPFVSILPFGTYLEDISGNILRLLASGLIFSFPALPEVFTLNPIPQIVNGSLWTLRYEIACYALVLFCGLMCHVRYTIPLALALWLACFWKEVVFPLTVPDMAYMHVTAFLLGACFLLYQKYIPLNAAFASCMLVLLVALFLFDRHCIPFYLLFTVYSTLYAASRLKYLGNFAKYGDFSYGMYIYAWPVQQAMGGLFHFEEAMFPAFVATSFLVTLLLSIFSYYFVERPALKLSRFCK